MGITIRHYPQSIGIEASKSGKRYRSPKPTLDALLRSIGAALPATATIDINGSAPGMSRVCGPRKAGDLAAGNFNVPAHQSQFHKG
jgi:hypothetical protein